MSFKIVDRGWDKLLEDAAKADRSSLRIICPFIKQNALARLLGANTRRIEIITRFSPQDMYCGVTDLSALRLLFERGARVRGVRGLHSKLYLFGGSQAVVTSANLTEAGLLRNQELGFISDETEIIKRCEQYFDTLWKKGRKLTLARLNRWEKTIAKQSAAAAGSPTLPRLPDEGGDAGFVSQEDLPIPTANGGPSQAFVKFFGEGHNREVRTRPVLAEVERSGSHWACSYPTNKIPRKVKDGAVMYLARIVQEPKDIIIYGRAIGSQYQSGRDDATEADCKPPRGFKKKWSRYIRVHSAEFIAGTLANGISLGQLKKSLGPLSFASTKRHLLRGSGKTDPNRAYLQQAHVELSEEGAAWMASMLAAAFAKHGRIPERDLRALDWPKAKSKAVGAGR